METFLWQTAMAPAKLNLFLHIVGQREDGYHLLQSLMVRVGLFDVLHFRRRTDGVIRLLNPQGNVLPENDLIVRAAKALQLHVGALQQGADILLDKRIPMGAGLGGGSSDAATTLLVLNTLWRAELSLELLAQIGLKLGADVPFFVMGCRSAWVEGIGEKVTPLPSHLPVAYCLMHPPIHVATAEVFRSPNLRRTDPPESRAAFSDASYFKVADNAMEATARELFPDLDHYASAFTDWVKEEMGWAPPRMTGSGSCFFVPLYEEDWQDGAGAAGALERAHDFFIYRAKLAAPRLWFVPQL